MSILLQRTQCFYFITFSGSEPTPQCNGLPKLTTPLLTLSLLTTLALWGRSVLTNTSFFGQNLTFSDAIFMFVNSTASALYLNSQTTTSLQLPWFIARFGLLLQFSNLQQFRQTFSNLWRCDSLRDNDVVVEIFDRMCRWKKNPKIGQYLVTIWTKVQKFVAYFLAHAVYGTL